MKKLKNISFKQSLIHLALIVLLIMVLYPIFILIIKSFKSAEQEMHKPLSLTFPLYFNNYKFAWLYVKDLILNTLIIAVSITLGSVTMCAITAYGFARFKFPLKNFFFMAFLSLMMIPGILTLIPQYALANKFGLINSYLGVIIPTVAGSIPFGMFLLRTFFSSLPNDLFEAAEIDGASSVRQFLMIAVPLSKPILFTLGVNSFMAAWNDLIWPSLILKDDSLHTISVGLIPFTEDFITKVGSLGVPLAGYVIVSIPLILVFSITSKQFIKGLTSGAFKL